MYRVKVLPGKLAGLNRYRCNCGHCEDLKDKRDPATQRTGLAAFGSFQPEG
jgi:hypothetical protein